MKGGATENYFKNLAYNMLCLCISMLILSCFYFTRTQHQSMQMDCNYSCNLQRPRMSVSGGKSTEQVAVIFLI